MSPVTGDAGYAGLEKRWVRTSGSAGVHPYSCWQDVWEEEEESVRGRQSPNSCGIRTARMLSCQASGRTLALSVFGILNLWEPLVEDKSGLPELLYWPPILSAVQGFTVVLSCFKSILNYQDFICGRSLHFSRLTSQLSNTFILPKERLTWFVKDLYQSALNWT